MKISKAGYTLIELLVVISIVGILTTIGIAAYNDFNEQRIIRKAADEIKTYVRLAKSKAINNEKDCSLSACDCDGTNRPLVGWDIDLVNLQIYGVCQTGVELETEFGQEDFLIGTTGLTITPASVIRFYPPASGGGTDLSSSINVIVNEETMLTIGENGVVSDYVSE